MNLKTRWTRWRERLRPLRHRTRLWLRTFPSSSAYRQYLSVQFDRSFSKRDSKPEIRAKRLIDRFHAVIAPPPDGPVLCIGARNTFEIELFRALGFRDVVGIDLFSESPDILVMDMHRLSFADRRFGVVYCCHSLEHAHDLGQVVREMLRVSRDGAVIVVEVPVKYQTSATDRTDFESAAGILAAFQPHVRQVFWTDEQPANSPENGEGCAVARAIFSIAKASH